MSKSFVEVSVNSLGVNDDSAVVIDLIVNEGDHVSVGDELVAIETTKSSFYVEATVDGYVVHLYNIDDEVRVGETVSLIVKEKTDISQVKDEYLVKLKSVDLPSDLNITKKAKIKAKKYNISLDEIKDNFSGIVREKDIDLLVNKDASYKKGFLPPKIIGMPVVKNIMIYGAVSSGASIVDIEIIHNNPRYRVVCFVDDDKSKQGIMFGLPVFSWDDFIHNKEQLKVDSFFISIANGVFRKEKVFLSRDLGITSINLVHPSAEISDSAVLGENVLIKRGAIIGPNARIGDGVFIDNGSIVSHDSIIGDYSHVAPGASLGGNVEVGELSIIGVGASITSDITLGHGSIVTTGSAVVNNYGEKNVIQGNPAVTIGKANITLDR